MLKLLGYVILSRHEVELQEQLAAQKTIALEERLSVQTERANKAYEEVEYYREKFEEAQDRADRQLDAFMNSVGMPEVTTTGKQEAAEREKKAQAHADQRAQELGEMFAETMNTFHNEDGLEMTPELEAEAKAMMAELGVKMPVEKTS